MNMSEISENPENIQTHDGVPATLAECVVCRQPTERKCSACKLTYYCCAEHQKTHWNEHKNSCRPYQLLQSAELGRYMVATRDLSRGDVIFSETPLVFGPKPHLNRDGPVPCVGCCKLITEENAVQCPECFWPACSQSCEGLKNNSRHGLECRVLQFRQPTPETHFYEFFRFDVLIVLRALFLQKINKAKFDLMLKLEDHLDVRGPGSDVFKDVDEKARFLYENYLKPLKEIESGDKKILEHYSLDLIHKIYAILDVNSSDIDEEVSATILYNIISILEHNCTPNTLQIMGDALNDYKITVRAAQSIPANANITSIYTHILWGTYQRRSHLKSLKYFDCTCARCRDPTEFGTNLSALRCLGTEADPCGGIQLPVNPLDVKVKWVCDKCKIKLPCNEIMKFVDHLGGEVDKTMAKKPSLEELEELLEKLLKFLHPNHFHIYTVKHTLIQLYNTSNSDGIELSSKFLQEKIEMCENLAEITKKIDPGYARLSLYLAVIYNELFKARFTLLQRDSIGETTKIVSQQLLKLLDNNLNVLKFEKESGPGKRLYDIVNTSKSKFLQWKETNNL